ncbi:MAG TPA: 50S ribosomal protein L25/general stress protein Ctc [Natronosporangium sp.]|nr:50S ribosomal protein L25/general stress protein Ctc [Natronosporangium sp.]
MSVTEINAEIRTEFGKGGARRTRRAGKLPAVLYGHGEPPKHLALPVLEFAAAIRRGGMTQLLTLTFPDGTKTTALPKAIQRDPIRDEYEHADLLVVRRGEKVTVEVPVIVVGDPVPGTLVVQELDTVSVTAEATSLPDRLEASVAGLDAGAQITAADLPLPEGTELVSEPDTVLVVVTASPTAAEMGVEEAPAEGEESGEAS